VTKFSTNIFQAEVELHGALVFRVLQLQTLFNWSGLNIPCSLVSLQTCFSCQGISRDESFKEFLGCSENCREFQHTRCDKFSFRSCVVCFRPSDHGVGMGDASARLDSRESCNILPAGAGPVGGGGGGRGREREAKK
jgi:hypothetical protein